MGFRTSMLACVGVVAALSFCGAAALGATVNLQAVKDASIYEDLPTNANGAGLYFHCGSNSGSDVRRALIQFDLSSIPANSTITAATLTLRMDDGGNSGPTETVELHKLTQSWSEGPTVGAGNGGHGSPAVAGDVTWTRRTYNTTSWTNAGGTFSATVSASASVSSAAATRTWTGAGVLADVQSWYSAPSGNFGWLLKGNEATASTARRFSSRQNPTASERPVLTITYTPPASTGACCQPSGTCLIQSSFACGITGNTYLGNGSTCVPNDCPQPQGACCTGTGVCSVTDLETCTSQGRYFQGVLTSCTPTNPCPVLSGACCKNNATCTFVSQLICAFTSGTYQGDNITCVAAACPWVLTPFVDALPIPDTAVPTTGTAGGAAHYDMFIRQFNHQFHSELPATTVVWGYNDQYPGPTIEARQGLQVTTTWVNDLRVNGPASALRTTHVLPIDTCLHGPDVTGLRPVTVTHLHGAHLRPDSDGDPDTAFRPGQTSTLYTYPNNQHAATLWYHDHALGLTRLNVYMGLAGFYLIRDANEDARSLPQGHNEVPLVIQDRSFTSTGQLKYNSTFTDHFFGDFICVNGKVWPYMNVNRGKYRFRLLNGSNTRTYTLRLSYITQASLNSVPAQQIGSDLGLLASPVSLGGGIGRPGSVTIMPGERADVIIDFGGYSAGDVINWNNIADVPFPGGGDGPDILNVMQFRVQAAVGDTGAIPSVLAPVPRTPESDATVTRDFTLSKETDTTCNHDMWLINQLMWDDITDFPQLGSTEIWRWINKSGLSHPMHIHLVEFQVLDRDNFTTGPNGEIIPAGSPTLPPTVERGWKDTVQATPNQITRVIAKFSDYPGTFPFHCHILDHEDHEMMRQFTVLCAALQPTIQPTSTQVPRGQAAGFAFNASGSSPLLFQWRRNGTPLVNGVTVTGSVISGATTSILTVSNVQPGDAGTYSCVITDPCGTTLTSANAPLSILCPADFNHSGTLEVADIFAFLNAWFAGQHAADFNNSGVLEVADIFDFLNAWFAGC